MVGCWPTAGPATYRRPLTMTGWPDAGDRAAGTPTPRRSAVAVRRGRRLALHGVRHQHHHWAAAVAGGPPPGACPRRGPDPLRERHPAFAGYRPDSSPSTTPG